VARDPTLIQGFKSMYRIRSVRVSSVLTGLALLGALSVTGCSDQQQSGTTVQDTPQAQEGRKASMDGMKAIMEKQKGQPKR
jgi:hypothetical protein